MAMTPTLWSQSALAVEFGLDRRTVAARLRGIQPSGTIKGGHDGWRLADVLPALTGYGGRRASAVDDASFEKIGAPFSTTGSQIDEALCVACVVMAHKIPWHAAMVAIYRGGASLSVAHALYRAMCMEMASLGDELVEGWGIVWRNADHYDVPLEPDWKAIAVQLGEKVDRAAWRRHEKRMGERFAAIIEASNAGA